MEPDNIDYVRLSEFTEQAEVALKQAVQSLKQLAGGQLRHSFSICATIQEASSGDSVAQGEIVATRLAMPRNR